MTPILLIGAGGHCRSCIDVIEQTGAYEIIGVVDNNPLKESSILGYPIIGTDADLPTLYNTCKQALVTVGQIKSAAVRISLYQSLQEIGFELPVIISPLAYVSKHAFIGPGSIVMHGAIVNSCARIGENCIINSRALIEHDAQVGKHCHVSTAAVVNGGAVVEDEVFLGSQSVLVQGAVVQKGYFLRANSLYADSN